MNTQYTFTVCQVLPFSALSFHFANEAYSQENHDSARSYIAYTTLAADQRQDRLAQVKTQYDQLLERQSKRGPMVVCKSTIARSMMLRVSAIQTEALMLAVVDVNAPPAKRSVRSHSGLAELCPTLGNNRQYIPTNNYNPLINNICTDYVNFHPAA